MIITPTELDTLSDEMDRFTARLTELGASSVRVFVTTNAAGNSTGFLSVGSGNYFAQKGQIKDWIIKGDEQTKRVVWDDVEEEDD